MATKDSSSLTYSKSGVDVKSVKKIQDKVNGMIATTQNKHSESLFGHYAGLFGVGGKRLTMHVDGVGSKVLVAQDVGKFDTVGIDALAMNVNDLVCVGSRPIVAVDYLALEKSDEQLVLDIVKGLVDGCKQSEVALIGGETAILPDIIKGSGKPFDLAVTCVGVLEKEITGKGMKAGDILICLESSGLHSNGYTLARRTLDSKKWGMEMLTPTRIYTSSVLEMINSCQIGGIAHITGGAFSKLMRIGAHAKVGFELDSVPKPAAIFEEIGKKVNSDYEMYRTFNMGVGMAIVVAEKDAA
ncbi:MAG TPA: phosphoribosylformylglycinamidine cyclo-ligase, partial [Candidatus Micrarchaeota archaeon]|nr:phosphoribosylformylglycinamidine cyclo-ligase [Candidatus Micrarchaeota archaeon]